MEREELGFRLRFWNIFCGFSIFIRFLLALCVTFLILLLIAYALLGVDEAGLAVLQINLLFLGVLVPALLYSLLRCRNLERRG